MRVQLIILFLLLCAVSISAKEKYALLIGVGDYPSDSGWAALSSTNDVELYKKTLLYQGFKEKNIITLIDQQATRKNILEALHVIMFEKVKFGEVMLMHFSGHGQQIFDQNNDELDGLDEAIVPIDAPHDYIEGVYEGENHIRDEELGEALYKIREKLGPLGQFFLTMDACHSGTGTRSQRVARGTMDIFGSDKDLETLQSDVLSAENILEEVGVVGELAPIVSFFSSKANQRSFECEGPDGKSYGFLSSAFCKAFSNLEQSATYRGLFDKIKKDVSAQTSLQSPQAEGNLDFGVFNNNFVGKPKYFQVKETITKNLLLIDGGSLQDVNVGSEITFYPNDTRDTSVTKFLAKGTVVFNSFLDAEIELEQGLENKKLLKNSWAFISNQNYGDLKLDLVLATNDQPFETSFRAMMSEVSVINIVSDYGKGALFLKSRGNKVYIESLDGYEVAEVDKSSGFLIKKLILGYVQAEYLRTLEISNPLMEGQLIIQSTQEARKKDDIPSFALEEKIEILIKNNGRKPFYFTILDIQPNNEVYPLQLAEDNRTAEEYFLNPGDTFKSMEMRIAEPLGTDVLKFICSSEPMDLSSIRGVKTRSVTNFNPFEKLLSETNAGENTRGTTSNIPKSYKVDVQSIIFEIKKQ